MKRLQSGGHLCYMYVHQETALKNDHWMLLQALPMLSSCYGKPVKRLRCNCSVGVTWTSIISYVEALVLRIAIVE